LTKGTANIATGQEMKLGDRVRTGSNTKSFVITVLLQLVDEGKVNLGDTLDKYDFGVQYQQREHYCAAMLQHDEWAVQLYTDKTYQELINANR